VGQNWWPNAIRRTAVAVLLIFSFPYGYGGAIEANVLMDHWPHTSYVARVEGRRIVMGKTTSYEVELGLGDQAGGPRRTGPYRPSDSPKPWRPSRPIFGAADAHFRNAR